MGIDGYLHKTVLVIAHWMRTVAESGRPEGLLATKGIFAGMIERQKVE
jgi:hypothetical protein